MAARRIVTFGVISSIIAASLAFVAPATPALAAVVTLPTRRRCS